MALHRMSRRAELGVVGIFMVWVWVNVPVIHKISGSGKVIFLVLDFF